jgi:hypothetical protein
LPRWKSLLGGLFFGLVAAPLTADEAWTAMAPGELQVFVDGAPLPCGTPALPPFNPAQRC